MVEPPNGRAEVSELDTIEVNHKEHGGQRNDLGTYVFTGTAAVVIISEGSCGTCADAVRFVSSAR